MWNKGLLYEGHKVLPYCPRCGTALASHEVAQGYAETEDPSVYVKFRAQEDPNHFYLVWTTTPWTLPSNAALAVNPGADYARAQCGAETWTLAGRACAEGSGRLRCADRPNGKGKRSDRAAV